MNLLITRPMVRLSEEKKRSKSGKYWLSYALFVVRIDGEGEELIRQCPSVSVSSSSMSTKGKMKMADDVHGRTCFIILEFSWR